MLATLNLQLSPVDLLDDTLAGPAAPLPETGGQANSGFAQLLRLRVDADLPVVPDSEVELLPKGEALPAGGNMLPFLSPLSPATALMAEPAGVGLASDAVVLPTPLSQDLMEFSREGLPTPKLAPVVKVGGDIELPGEIASEELAKERPDISFDSAVVYPPPTDVFAEPSDLAETPLALPANKPVPLTPQVSQARSDTFEGGTRRSTTAAPPVAEVTKSELAARSQEFFAAPGERLETPPGSVGLRDRGQQPMPQVRPSPANMATQQLDVTEKLPPTELPRRPELLPLQVAGAVRDPVTETIQSRPSIPQIPHAQLTPQPAQVAFTAAPVTAAVSESTYATVAQQATEFIGTPVRDAAWGEQISERVVVMAGNNLKSAEIRLTPAELGPLRIRVSVEDGAANVTFHAQQAVTREAIEQAMPRLREMLAENGLSLGQAEVGEQGIAGRDEDGQGHGELSDQAGDESSDVELDDASRTASTLNKQNGLVDTFA